MTRSPIELSWTAKKSTYPFDLEIKLQFYVLFVAKRVYALYLSRKTIYALFGRENDLRTSSGKFLCVEFCHPESSDFLGLWGVPEGHTSLVC